MSARKAAAARDALFGRRGRHPYYIEAPAYTQASAGIRALYVLCHALLAVGEEAYIVTAPKASDDAAAPDVEGLRAPCLADDVRARHHQLGRTPIVVAPETFPLPETDAIRTVYLLNYLGILGGPRAYCGADLILGYSQSIARRTPGCELALHIPVVDPRFWTPDPAAGRSGVAVYAGKYVEHHGQELPTQLAGATVITRHSAEAPTRLELRAIFRTSTRLYVFENTAVAMEAALCGCPVVCMFNPFFDELISAAETGVEGFAFGDAPAEIERAERTVHRFRSGYARAGDAFAGALHSFILRSQALARERVYDRPYIGGGLPGMAPARPDGSSAWLAPPLGSR